MRKLTGQWRKPGLAIVAVTMVWVVMNLWNFGLPGLQADEVNHYAFIPGVKSAEAAALPHYRLPDNYFDYQDRKFRFPILGGSVYNSAISTYLGLPFFAVTGHSPASVRMFSGLIGLAGLLAVVTLIGRLAGWPAALIAGLVISTDPSHIMSIRSQGYYFWLVVLFAALAANFLLEIRRRKVVPVWLPAAAGACTGWCVMAYFVGLFVAVPLVVAAVLLLRYRPGHLIVFAAAGLLAYAPVLYALFSIHAWNPELLSNLGMPDWTVREAMPVLSLQNLERLQGMAMGAFGTHDFASWITGRIAADHANLRLMAFGTGLLLIGVCFSSPKLRAPERQVFFATSISICLLYFAGLLVFKATSVHHLLPLTVLASALVAALIGCRGVVRWLGAAACLILVVSNLLATQSAQVKLQETGGRGFHNENYSRIAPVLSDQLGEYHPVFTGWGFHLQFLFLTDGRSPYTVTHRPSIDRLQSLLHRHERLAVVVAAADRLTVLDVFVAKDELRYAQRNGTELFSILLLSIDDQVHGPPMQ
jgi:hypothetical protein